MKSVRKFFDYMLFFSLIAAVLFTFFGDEILRCLYITFNLDSGSGNGNEDIILIVMTVGDLFLSYVLYYIVWTVWKGYAPAIIRAFLVCALLILVLMSLLSRLILPGIVERDKLFEVQICLYAIISIPSLAALSFIAYTGQAIKTVLLTISDAVAGKPPRYSALKSCDETESLSVAVDGMADSLFSDTRSVNRLKELYSRFLPRRLPELLNVTSINDIDRSVSTSREMFVIVVRFGFKDQSVVTDPGELFARINSVTERSSMIVGSNTGTMFNLTHDGFIVVFQEPEQAIRTAMSITGELSGSGKALTLHIGIDYGLVMFGIIGDAQRMAPTAVSAAINNARALLDYAQKCEASIICSERVYEKCENYEFRYVGKLGESVDSEERVYELFEGDEAYVRDGKRQTLKLFGEGILEYNSGNYAEAKRIFMNIARLYPGDRVNRWYLYLADAKL